MIKAYVLVGHSAFDATAVVLFMFWETMESIQSLPTAFPSFDAPSDFIQKEKEEEIYIGVVYEV